jgi:hypothetical protein
VTTHARRLHITDRDISDVNVSTRYLIVGNKRAKLAVGERLKSSIGAGGSVASVCLCCVAGLG